MTNSKSMKLTALLLAGVLATSCFVGGTLARYVTSTSSEDSARVAVWGINADEVTMDLFDATYTVNGVTVAQSEDGDNIIAPGTEKDNYFSIVNLDDNLKPEVMYEVAINLDDSEIDPLILNNPSIVWRLDEGTYGTWEETKAQVLALSGDASGVKTYAPLEIAENFKAGKTHKIGWKWIMDNNNNVMDTEMGNKAVDGDISAKISIKVTATQVNVDTTGMLNGNGQVYDVNNPTPLVFRSAAPVNELQSVEVNGDELTQGTDYTVSSGSTIITLTESCINRLGAGNYTISIISENMTAKASFTIAKTEEITENVNVLIHSGTIPVGGTYYIGINETVDGGYIYDENDFSSATEILTEGNNFPETPSFGDVYVYRDYMYKYEFVPEYAAWWSNENSNEWGVMYIGNSSTTAEEVIHSINGNMITNLTQTYFASMLEIAPTIPTHVTDMTNAFEDSFNLTTIELNHVPRWYGYMLKNTNVTEIGGTISEEEKNIMIENGIFGY